jgi:hypothetical protein
MASTEIGSHAELPPKSADDVSATHSRWWHALLHADAVALDTLLADNLTFTARSAQSRPRPNSSSGCGQVGSSTTP